jgi:hypothetical protein
MFKLHICHIGENQPMSAKMVYFYRRRKFWTRQTIPKILKDQCEGINNSIKKELFCMYKSTKKGIS